jgi:hypothetical protein
VIAVDQLRCEIIEYVRCVSKSSKKNQWRPRTAPIEDLQLYVFIDCDELEVCGDGSNHASLEIMELIPIHKTCSKTPATRNPHKLRNVRKR